VASSIEKLAAERDGVVPHLRRMIDEAMETAPRPVAVALAALKPFILKRGVRWVDEQLATRDAAAVDQFLARVIDELGKVRSDDAAVVVADPAGARYLAPHEAFGSHCRCAELGDRVQPPAVRDGGDPDGQEHVGAGDVPLGGAAAVGDRSAGL
jgi:hypothetical protein